MKPFLLVILCSGLFFFIADLNAQDEEGALLKELTEALEEEIEAMGDELEDLLDVEAMAEEVDDLIEPTRKEKKAVREALEAFRDYFNKGGNSTTLTINGKTIQLGGADDDEDWLGSIVEEAAETLEAGKVKRLSRWLIRRQAKVDECGDELGELAGQLGAEIGKWAEAFAANINVEMGDIEEWASEFEEEMEEFGEAFGEDMEDWAEDWALEFADDWETLGEQLGDDWEEWGEQFGKDMEAWGEDMRSDWGDWAEDFASDIEDCVEDLEDGDDAAQAILKQLGKKSFRELPLKLEKLGGKDFGKKIQRMVERSLSTIPRLRLEIDGNNKDVKKMQKEIQSYAENVSGAAQNLRRLLETKRRGGDKKATNLIELLNELSEAAIDRADANDPFLKQLKKEREQIHSRDNELDSLKDEIESLKKEIKKLKKDKKLLYAKPTRLEDMAL